MEFLYLDDFFTVVVMMQRKVFQEFDAQSVDSMETLQDYKRNFQEDTN